jgi:PAS domain S-box-containing protein
VNRRAEEILGYSEAELRGRSWETIVAEADNDYVGEVVEKLLADDGGTRAVNTNVRRDGETRICRWHNRVVTDADGGVRTVFSKFEDVTEQEERKRELREVSGQYRALVDNFPSGAVFLYDTDRRVVRSGGSELSSVGLSSDDITGTTPHDRYPPAIAEKLVDSIESAFTGESHTFEQEYGGACYRVQMVPVRTDDGEIPHVMAVSKNITERKERELELERYERLVEALPVGVFRTTIDGEIIDINEAAMDIYGAESRAELRDVEVGELYIDDSDRDDLLDRLQEAGRVENELLEFETLEGDHRFVRATITLNEEGESSHLEGILQDVTSRRELEREFAQIKTVAESLNDAVYVLDELGRFTYVNKEFLELTGYAERTILGNTPEIIKDEAAVDTAERQLGRLLSDEGPDNVTFETTIQPDDGDEVVCEDHMGVLPYEGDSFNGSVGVLRDITERKRRERELRRERDRLDEFASVVSHDLRNPLNVAQGNTELLDSECDTDRIERIRRAHTRMDNLIDDLLTLARQGETISDVEPVALEEIAETTWRAVESPHASLHVETDRTVRCDSSRLRQLLENLYRNAVEHGGDGVTVAVGAMDDGFYVADTGPGIPESDRAEVFEPGYSTNENGTGFGLRIVEQIADAHRWEVTVTESEGGGARFEFTGVERVD